MIAYTHPGCRHGENQDHYRAGRLADDTHWMVLCDGMGGAASGGEASGMAVAFLAEHIERRMPDLLGEQEVKRFLQELAGRCNRLILEQGNSQAQPVTMGTTLVMAVVRGGLAQMIHAGDSRAYVMQKGILRQITHDHSVVQELLDCGKITPEQAYNHPNKNIITSALGVDVYTKIDYNEVRLGKGDLLLLCSDGLTNMLKDAEIAHILRETEFFHIAARLVERAVEAGGYDNITTVALEG